VVISWGRTIYTQFELLAGKSASHDFLQLLIYKSATFSQQIDKIDTVRAYHVSSSNSMHYSATDEISQSGPVRDDAKVLCALLTFSFRTILSRSTS
jgi:hypothetical protein